MTKAAFFSWNLLIASCVNLFVSHAFVGTAALRLAGALVLSLVHSPVRTISRHIEDQVTADAVLQEI